ncbi:MAG: SDR family oxidoreductase [Desulfomonile tiedjei]|uniref:SDR family oxidoreductase n=1 Tax=Desulfomonile tiedjei TaxID=2358 RepID=A0A9D6V768_9BACT|nr:SDR family oxidoreductase [Desulfomonile tiedjei]
MSEKILVTGATGNLGSAVVKALAGRGASLRAASTDPTKLRLPEGVERVKLVYQDPSTYEAALGGVEGLFLVAPPLDPDAPAKLRPVIAQAKALGVGHIVFNSALGVDQNEEAPLRVVELALMDAGVKYTILRPNFFMENFSTGWMAPMIKEHGTIFVAADEGKTSFISTRDIAEVAAIAFEKKLYSEAFDLTGSEALSHAEVAGIMSAASGKLIAYQCLSEDGMLQGARSQGMPEGAVQYLGFLYSFVRAGYMAATTHEVENVTGRKPRTFAEFAQDSAVYWK